MLKEVGVHRMWFSYGVTTMDKGIGYAESTDGILWEEDPNNPILHTSDGVAWRSDRTYAPSVLKDGWTYKMWFTGVAANDCAIGYTTLEAAPPLPPVGGEWVPTDTPRLLIPWITSAALIMMLAASFVCIKRKKNQQT